MSDPCRVGIKMTDGRVFHMTVMGRGRFPSRPRDGFWQVELDRQGQPTGYYVRDAGDQHVISFEINKSSYLWVRPDPASPIPAVPALPVSWRVLRPAEHALFEQDRVYRNALAMTGDVIAHDMPRARECHRAHIRKHRVTAMAVLDAKWMSATGRKQAKDADRIEAERQALRDAPADPRIEAAATIDELKKLKV